MTQLKAVHVPLAMGHMATLVNVILDGVCFIQPGGIRYNPGRGPVYRIRRTEPSLFGTPPLPLSPVHDSTLISLAFIYLSSGVPPMDHPRTWPAPEGLAHF